MADKRKMKGNRLETLAEEFQLNCNGSYHKELVDKVHAIVMAMADAKDVVSELYMYDDEQIKVFNQMAQLAQKLQLEVVKTIRDSFDNTLKELTYWQNECVYDDDAEE